MATISIIPAKIGDTVELGTKEYDIIDGGKALRMSVATKVQKNYSRDGIVSLKAQLEAQLVEVDAIIAEMDSKGVGTGPQEL